MPTTMAQWDPFIALLSVMALLAMVFFVWSALVWDATPQEARHWTGLLPTVAALLLLVICVIYAT